MASTPRPLISRLSPYFSVRLRQNSRLLSSSYALREPRTLSPESTSESPDDLHLTDSCVRRMKELQADEGSEKLLRLSIEAGGCSGFQYKFSLDDTISDDDRLFEQDGVKVVVDKISHGFVKGATVDFVEELIRSAFQVIFTCRGRTKWAQDVVLMDYFLRSSAYYPFKDEPKLTNNSIIHEVVKRKQFIASNSSL